MRLTVEFESLGTDRRLPMDLESAVFRVTDEAVVALLGGTPERITMTLDWSDELLALCNREIPTALDQTRSAAIKIALFHALGRLPEPEHAHRFA